MKSIALLLAHATAEQVNSCVSARDLRTPLHLACAMGNLPVAQLLIWVSHIFLYFLFVCTRVPFYVSSCKKDASNECFFL
jgi:hypothetical protein